MEELFCPKCKRLKRRCKCQSTTREKNLQKLNRNYKDFLKPIFDCEDEIVYYEVLEPFNDLPTEDLDFLPPQLSRVLKYRGIEKLYTFQKRAMELLLDGKNVVITAPTGFGKTEAFAIPMLKRVEEGKALVFYPTKALARDQEVKLRNYASVLGLKVVRFDGDSGEKEREAVLRGEADVILTNPDMVDYHLRKNLAFRKIVRKIVFVAVDELQVYTGFFGSNMYYLMKRLQNFAEFQIAATSATISNAKEFAEELFERSFIHVHGEHRKATLNLIMRYCSTIYSAIAEIVKKYSKKKILVFGNSYKVVEVANWILRKSEINSEVHKAGLPKEVRERIERDFRDGKLRVVVATPTLELGIDIGDVDFVISELVPYPQLIQRLGRAGRRGQEAIGVILLRSDDSISTYYKNKPEEYFSSELFGFVEKENEEVAKYHALAMLLENEKAAIPENLLKKLISESLVNKNLELTPAGYKFFEKFSMRGIGDAVRMVCDGKVIGERTLPVAIEELYPNAIVIHGGRKYRCKSIDLSSLEAILEPSLEGEDITDPLYVTIPKVLEVKDVISEPVNAVYCSLQLEKSVYGYVKREIGSNDKKVFFLDEPVKYVFKTKGFLFSCPFPDDEDPAGSFHAFEHVLIEGSNALIGGSRELGGISTPEGDIFVYDAIIGGCGLSKLLFRRLQKAFEISATILKSCSCERKDGCPRCTYSYRCGNNNQPLSKKGAIDAVSKILAGEKRELNFSKYSGNASFKFFP